MEEVSTKLHDAADNLSERAAAMRTGQVSRDTAGQTFVVAELGPSVKAVCCVMRSGEVRIAISP